MTSPVIRFFLIQNLYCTALKYSIPFKSNYPEVKLTIILTPMYKKRQKVLSKFLKMIIKVTKTNLPEILFLGIPGLEGCLRQHGIWQRRKSLCLARPAFPRPPSWNGLNQVREHSCKKANKSGLWSWRTELLRDSIFSLHKIFCLFYFASWRLTQVEILSFVTKSCSKQKWNFVYFPKYLLKYEFDKKYQLLSVNLLFSNPWNQ